MHQSSTLDIGLDVHKASLAVAYMAKGHHAEVVYLGTIDTRHSDSDKRSRNLHSKATPLLFVYEAGPWGSWLDRSLRNKGYACWIVAPSRMPQKAGDRVQTDRRDALPLARLRRSGALTPVYVPKAEDEAIRDLCRARADAIHDLKAAMMTEKKLRPPLDTGSHINAGPELRRMSGATKERTLFPVSSRPWFGILWRRWGSAMLRATEKRRAMPCWHAPFTGSRRSSIAPCSAAASRPRPRPRYC
jgi:transposase